METLTEQKSVWYEKRSIVILWLIFFFPVGLYGMWKSSQFSDMVKWIVTCSFGVLFVFSSAGDKNIERIEPSKQTSSQSLEVAPTAPSQLYPQAAEQTQISWMEIDEIYNIMSERTDLQKSEAWKRFIGKKVVWSGIVTDISDGFTGLTMQVKMNSNTITSDVLVHLKNSERDKALKLQQNGHVKYSGRLVDWGSFLPITIDNGEIL
jgi:hypothetical protein